MKQQQYQTFDSKTGLVGDKSLSSDFRSPSKPCNQMETASQRFPQENPNCSLNQGIKNQALSKLSLFSMPHFSPASSPKRLCNQPARTNHQLADLTKLQRFGDEPKLNSNSRSFTQQHIKQNSVLKKGFEVSAGNKLLAMNSVKSRQNAKIFSTKYFSMFFEFYPMFLAENLRKQLNSTKANGKTNMSLNQINPCFNPPRKYNLQIYQNSMIASPNAPKILPRICNTKVELGKDFWDKMKVLMNFVKDNLLVAYKNYIRTLIKVNNKRPKMRDFGGFVIAFSKKYRIKNYLRYIKVEFTNNENEALDVGQEQKELERKVFQRAFNFPMTNKKYELLKRKKELTQSFSQYDEFCTVFLSFSMFCINSLISIKRLGYNLFGEQVPLQMNGQNNAPELIPTRDIMNLFKQLVNHEPLFSKWAQSQDFKLNSFADPALSKPTFSADNFLFESKKERITMEYIKQLIETAQQSQNMKIKEIVLLEDQNFLKFFFRVTKFPPNWNQIPSCRILDLSKVDLDELDLKVSQKSDFQEKAKNQNIAKKKFELLILLDPEAKQKQISQNLANRSVSQATAPNWLDPEISTSPQQLQQQSTTHIAKRLMTKRPPTPKIKLGVRCKFLNKIINMDEIESDENKIVDYGNITFEYLHTLTGKEITGLLLQTQSFRRILSMVSKSFCNLDKQGDMELIATKLEDYFLFLAMEFNSKIIFRIFLSLQSFVQEGETHPIIARFIQRCSAYSDQKFEDGKPKLNFEMVLESKNGIKFIEKIVNYFPKQNNFCQFIKLFLLQTFENRQNDRKFARVMTLAIIQWGLGDFESIVCYIEANPRRLVQRCYIDKVFVTLLKLLDNKRLFKLWKKIVAENIIEELIIYRNTNQLIQEFIQRDFQDLITVNLIKNKFIDFNISTLTKDHLKMSYLEFYVFANFKQLINRKYTKYVICPMLRSAQLNHLNRGGDQRKDSFLLKSAIELIINLDEKEMMTKDIIKKESGSAIIVDIISMTRNKRLKAQLIIKVLRIISYSMDDLFKARHVHQLIKILSEYFHKDLGYHHEKHY